MGIGGDPRSDEELLDAMDGGDRGALAVLYDRHAPWLHHRLARRCPDTEVVDDALQDTFVAVWRRPSAYAGTGAVGAWLWGIAARKLVDRLRRRSRLARLRPTREVAVASAEEPVMVAAQHDEVAAALNRLSPELRAVLQAVVLDGLSTADAARLLRIPVGTVKTRAMRARAELRAALL